MSEGEEVYQKRDIILARLDENMKHAIKLIEENKAHAIELIQHNRSAIRDHVDSDTLKFDAVDVAINDLEDKVNANHNFLLQIVLPATGVAGTIIMLINILHR